MGWEERVWGYDGAGGMIQGFAAGYFLWDLIICVRFLEVFGWGLLAHAVAALVVFSLGFVSFFLTILLFFFGILYLGPEVFTTTFHLKIPSILPNIADKPFLPRLNSAPLSISTAQPLSYTSSHRRSSISTGFWTSSA